MVAPPGSTTCEPSRLLQPVIIKALQGVYLVCLKLPFRKQVKAEVAPERLPVTEKWPCVIAPIAAFFPL